MVFEKAKQKGLFLIGVLVITLFFSLARSARTAETRDVVINEIAWMGTGASDSDEWIEFYNRTGSEIDIATWSIHGADSGACLDFSDADNTTTTVIEPYGYLVYGAHENDVKNSDGEPIVDIWDATIGLKNSSPGQVILYDSSGCEGNEIDTANQSEGDWFAGDNDAKKTMERVSPCDSGTDPDNWTANDPESSKNGQNADGEKLNATPNVANSGFQNTKPTADLSSPESVDTGEELKLDGSSSEDCEGSIDSYSWDLDGDGSFDDASGDTATYTADEAGEIEVGLKVEDDHGKTNSTTRTVTVEDETNKSLEADPGGSYSCSPEETITLDGSESRHPDGTIEKYLWDLDGDGQYDDATGVEPTYICDSNGSQNIGLKVTDGSGKSDTASTTVEVTASIQTDFSYSPDDPVAGEEVEFTADISPSGVSVTSREWYFGDGGRSTTRDPTHVYSTDGTYTVTLAVEGDSEEEDFHTEDIKVSPRIEVDTGSSITVDLGESVKLESSVSTADTTSEVEYSWETVEKPEESRVYMRDPTASEPIIVPNKPGEYRLKFIGLDSSGTSASDETTVTVNDDPEVDEEEFAVEFISEENTTFENREELSLEIELKHSGSPNKGSIIAHGMEEWPEFTLESVTPLSSVRELDADRLECGTVDIRYFYSEGKLEGSLVEKSLNLFYYLPDKGWLTAVDSSVHPQENYVSGEIPIPKLEDTPIALAGKKGSVGEEELVVHGPNPVPEEGCIFWFDLPEDIDGANLKIYDTAGKLLVEENLDTGQKSFPKVGRWRPVDEYGNQLGSGIYLYRVQLVSSKEVYWSDVKKLVIGG